jgi:endonuclease YncB( thermonuclease family)
MGEVVGVADGDSITVLRDKTQVKIRLYGIDCPERRQAFGNRAKQFTAKIVFRKQVKIEAVDTVRCRIRSQLLSPKFPFSSCNGCNRP